MNLKKNIRSLTVARRLLWVSLLLVSAFDANAQWRKTNSSVGININALAAKDSILVAGSDTGGVFVSYDNGASWKAASNGPGSRNIKSLLFKGNLLVAGIGNGLSSGATFTSTDSGKSWKPATTPYYGYLFCMTLNGSDLLAGTWYGVIRSTNSGQTWTTLSTTGFPSNPGVSALAFNGSYIFAGVNNSGGGGTGAFLSTNNGGSWTTKNNGLTNTDVNALAVKGTMLFAGTNNSVYRTKDSGANWSHTTNGITTTNINTLLVLGNNIFAGTDDGVFVTYDDGENWTRVSDSLPANTSVWSLVLKGNYLFAGTGSGVWKIPASKVVTGIYKVETMKHLEIFPNPSQGICYLNTENLQGALDVEVVNTLGEKVYTVHIGEKVASKSLDLRFLPKGIYFIHAHSNFANAESKIVLE